MSTEHRTDVLLWRVRRQPGAESPRRVSLADGLQASCVAWSATEGSLYVYATLPQRRSLGAQALPLLAAGLLIDGEMPPDATVSRLQEVLHFPGASSTAAAANHYVVETDAEEGWMDEIARWYADEHMPGLARVPGCISARRFVNHDHGPRSLACYDLARADVLGSPAWLAVRGTEWSSRTRPHFVNTRRTMFDKIAPPPG